MTKRVSKPKSDMRAEGAAATIGGDKFSPPESEQIRYEYEQIKQSEI